MRYRVIYSPEAARHLDELYVYIALEGSPAAAERYTSAVVATCESLSAFPQRGAPRGEIREGLRLTYHGKRTVISYTVDEATLQVEIAGVFHGGRDYRSALTDDPAGT
jgi:plasmid stabilization system protein ParE